MKNSIILALMFISLLLFAQCKDEQIANPTTPEKDMGELVLNSIPSGAVIYLLGTNTNENTPQSFTLEVGTYDVELNYADYFDTTFVVEIHKELTTTRSIEMISKITPSPYYNISGDWLLLYVRFNYDVYLQEVEIVRPNQQLTTKHPNVSINKNFPYEIARYLLANGNINGHWEITFIGRMMNSTTHQFNKVTDLFVN